MVAFPRPHAAKTATPAPTHIVVDLTPKSSHAYMGLLILGALISELRQEFPWRADLAEASELIVEIANDLDLKPAKKKS